MYARPSPMGISVENDLSAFLLLNCGREERTYLGTSVALSTFMRFPTTVHAM
jgi:hypothetical protein